MAAERLGTDEINFNPLGFDMTPVAAIQPVILVFAIMMLIVFIFILLMFAITFAPWLQAYMSGTPVSLFSIIGMQFRKIPVKTVVSQLIMANQAGVNISCNEMERAYLQGVDIEKITLAMIHANREGGDFTFQELVEADLSDRLNEKLGR